MDQVGTLWVQDDVDQTAILVRATLGYSDRSEDGELRITGLEPLIVALALKAVVGVVSGFAGRAFFDKWRGAKTRKDLDQLVDSLAHPPAAGSESAVDEATIRDGLVDALTLEGLTDEQARAVCDGVVERVRSRMPQR